MSKALVTIPPLHARPLEARPPTTGYLRREGSRTDSLSTYATASRDRGGDWRIARAVQLNIGRMDLSPTQARELAASILAAADEVEQLERELRAELAGAGFAE